MVLFKGTGGGTPKGDAAMKLQPLGKRVIVEPMSEEQTTISGLVIPQQAKERPQKGKVTARGPEVTEVSVNDIVLFGKYAGSDVKVDGRECLIMDVTDVFCVVKE